MSEEKKDMTPELTLTPNLDTATAAAEAPQLTLDPMAAETEVKQADQAVRDANAIHLDESMLSESERKMVADFAEKIDVTDSNLVLQYGAAAQKNIAGFSESALGKVRTKDLGEVGKDLAGLVGELEHFGQEEKGGIFGFLQKKKNDIAALKAQYSKAETNVNKIVEVLEGHQIGRAHV